MIFKIFLEKAIENEDKEIRSIIHHEVGGKSFPSSLKNTISYLKAFVKDILDINKPHHFICFFVVICNGA
jgi:hypothetical protein